MRLRSFVYSGLLAALVLCAGCGSRPMAGQTSAEMSADVGQPMAPPLPGAGEASAPVVFDKRSMAAKAPAEPNNPAPLAIKIIYTGNMTVEVENVAPAVDQVKVLAGKLGGYVSQLTQDLGGAPRATLTVRVPSAKFDALMSGAGAIGRVINRSVTAEDVSEEWVDVEARIKTKRLEETRLLALLEKAANVSALLEVERELGTVRQAIEQAEGRMRYLTNQVQLSTVTIELYTPLQVGREPGWSYGTVWSRATVQFVRVGHFVIALVTYLIVLAPYWVPLMLLVSWLRRRRQRARAGRA